MTTSLTLYGTQTASTTLSTACTLVTSTGGVSANKTSKIGTATGYGELYAQGNTGAWTAGGSLPGTAGVHGWLWDVTTLEQRTMLGGTWTIKWSLSLNAAITTFASTLFTRLWKRSSGGTLTQIGSTVSIAANLTTSQVTYTATVTGASAMAFDTGDKLYLEDPWLNITSNSGGASTRTVQLFASSSSSNGIANQVEIDTPGYIATPASLSYKNTVLADAPVRYYRLDEPSGSTATDSSTSAQNGTITGTVSYSQAGAIRGDSNAAIGFTGNAADISVPTTGLPTGASVWSAECWVYFATLPAAAHYPVEFAFGTHATGQEITFYFNGDSQKFTCGVTGVSDIFALAVASATTWYHLVATYDGTTVRFYVNGVLQDTLTTTLSLAYASPGMTIGNEHLGATNANPSTAIVDEVAVYSATLSAAQVQTHAAAGLVKYPSAALRTLVRTQATKSSSLRVPVRTQVTKSLGVRALIRTQKTASAALRTLVRTRKTVSTVVRAPVGTLHSLSTGLRTRVRTLNTDSTSVRTPVRTQHTLSTPLRAVVRGITKLVSVRVLVRTQVTQSLPVRVLARALATVTTGLRVPVRTQASTSVVVRALVRTQASTRAPVRALVRTQQSLSVVLRVIVSTSGILVTRSVVVRALVRTQHTFNAPVMAVVRSTASRVAALRTRVRTSTASSLSVRAMVATRSTESAVMRLVLRGITSVVAVRLLVRTPVSRLTQMRAFVHTRQTAALALRSVVTSRQTARAALRTRVATARSLMAAVRIFAVGRGEGTLRLRARVRSQQQGSAALRVIVVRPTPFYVRAGTATLVTRAGDAAFTVRAGTATLLVDEDAP